MIPETTSDDYSSKRDLFFNIDNERVHLEELGSLFEDGLADELTYTMGEFILHLPLMPYYYRETVAADGQKRLTSPGFGPTDMLNHFGQPYLLKSGLGIYSSEAIVSLFEQMPLNEARNNREAAEAKGFAKLRQLIFTTPDHSLFGWISPPINSNGYSMTYFGQVKPAKKGRYVEMVACKNHLSLEGHRQFLKHWGKELKAGLAGDRAEDFLLSPFTADAKHLSDLSLSLYTFDPRSPQKSQLDFEVSRMVLERIRQQAVAPHLKEFIKLMKADEDVNPLLDKIELAAVKACLPKLIDERAWETTGEHDRDLYALSMLISLRRETPKDGGSCPAVNRRDSLMTSINELINALSDGEDEPEKCPNCAEVRREHPDAGCCKGCRFK